jgi:hypothetical protein
MGWPGWRKGRVMLALVLISSQSGEDDGRAKLKSLSSPECRSFFS